MVVKGSLARPQNKRHALLDTWERKEGPMALSPARAATSCCGLVALKARSATEHEGGEGGERNNDPAHVYFLPPRSLVGT